MLRVLRLYLKVAIFQPELRQPELQEHAPRTTFLYLRAAIFKPELREHAPRTTFVLKSCDCQAGAAADQGESNPGPRDCESRRANHETTSKGRYASKKIARRHSESDPTSTIPAEHGTTARAIRHARSVQRVHRAQDRFARDHSESDATPTIPAEGSSGFRQARSPLKSAPGSRQIRMGPQRERFDTHDLRRGFAAVKIISHGATARALRHDLRRGFAAVKTNSHGTTATALRHARSPQRVRRGQDRFARRHSESDATRTIPADGSSGARQIRTGP